MKLRLLVAFLLLPALAGEAPADEHEPEFLRQDDGSHRFLIVDKSDAPVFGTADAATPERGREVALGDFFFALAENEERILVARYEPLEEVGWMNKSDLLEGDGQALTVAEGMDLGLENDIRTYDLEGSFGADNVLFLRVVTQPEQQTRLRGRPGGGEVIGNPILSWRWYYVFDREEVDGETWLLLAEQRAILAGSTFEDTHEEGPRQLLRGWAPLEEMTIWATNLALELNTDPHAVTRRVADNDPATVSYSIHRQARPVWQEPLASFWAAGGTRPELSDMVATDPLGIGPYYPRVAIMQAAEGNLQVASVASMGDQINPSTIGKIQRQIRYAVRSLLSADVVFVVDATGSMRPAIRETKALVDEVGKALRQFQETGVATTLSLPGGRREVFSNNLDIRVSIIGFQDTREVVAERRRRGGKQTYNVEPKVVQADLVANAGGHS